MRELQSRLVAGVAALREIPLQVRVGLHTGLAVIGAMSDGVDVDDRHAVGDTPTIAARVQGLADPDTLVITEAAQRLLRDAFVCRPLGPRALPGIAAPVSLYQVLREREPADAVPTDPPAWSAPFVGREQEAGLLQERWAEVQEGRGQIVVITGEAGIGKTRLVHALKTHAQSGPHRLLETRCSPHHQHSALHPLAELLAGALEIERPGSLDDRLTRLEQALRQTGFSPADVVPFLAPLLTLSLPEHRYPSLSLSPERWRRRTLQTALSVVLELSAKVPVLLIVEDLHWVDPSTEEWLSLLVEQVATARVFALFTARPEFASPWAARTHVTPLTLSRLRRAQMEGLILGVAEGKSLPSSVIEQIATKTDGVPLFVEELTKMVLESGLLQEQAHRYDLIGPLPPLAIPATLQDSLMARLDRLNTVKAVAQIAATIGRAFPYALLQAISDLDEDALRRDLAKLVQAELLYQRGVPPRATYTFKHALIQDAAYQALLKSTRQHYHRRIAQALEANFPELVESEPEQLAHHYTEAGLGAQAIQHWQRAGEDAAARSADIEAINHLTNALELVAALPAGPERAQREIALRLARGVPLMAARGHASAEVELEYRRARELCQHVEDQRLRFRALGGLYVFYLARGELETARQLAQQCMALAERGGDAAQLVRTSAMLGQVRFYQGELSEARGDVERGIALYRSGRYHPRATGPDSLAVCLAYGAWALWLLGFPDQALARSHEALALARERAHPHDLAATLHYANVLDQLRRDGGAVAARAEHLIALASEHGFPLWLGFGHLMHGWAEVDRGGAEEGLAEMRRGVVALRATGQGTGWPYHLLLMASACRRLGQMSDALALQAEAVTVGRERGEHCWDAELGRVRGELLRRQATPDPTGAEACFRQAIETARRQGARAWELRAVTSLSRLLRERDEREEPSRLLADIYGRFTEGFETADLRDAREALDVAR
jgi:predicted ATPase